MTVIRTSGDIGNFLGNLSRRLLRGSLGQPEIDSLMVMHHFAKLIFTMNSVVKLYSYLCHAIGLDQITLSTKDDIEGVGIETRHLVLQIIAYLMLDLEPSLRKAIEMKAIRYNHLKKDFDTMPEMYAGIVENLSKRRMSPNLTTL